MPRFRVQSSVRARAGRFIAVFTICLAASSPAVADSVGDWELLETAPLGRYFAVTAYDPTSDRMFVFGGQNEVEAYFDTWWLTLRDEPNWTRVATPNSPPGFECAYVFDPVRNRVVAFGGRYDADLTTTTWSHALGSSMAWTQQATSGPPPSARDALSGVYDSARDGMVVFGGHGYVGINEVYFNDVHRLNFASNSWTPIAVQGTPPTRRAEHAAIYDPVRDRMIVFGGTNGSIVSSELWTLDFTPTPTWHLISPAGPTPSARAGAAVLYDAARDRMILFGGGGTANETWALSLSNLSWSQLSIGPGPSGRDHAAVIYDPVEDRMILYAGRPGVRAFDTWALSLSGTPAWTLLHAGYPGPRTEHSAIRVPSKDQMVVFGGYGNYRISSSISHYNSVFTLQLGTENWIQLAPSGTPPSARWAHSAIFDAANNRMLVYGGKSPNGAVTYSELWSLSLSGAPAWTLLSPSGASPGPRSNHTAIFDPVRNRMILYGGANGDDGVYALSLTGLLQWSHLVVGGASPGARNGHAAIYDPVRDRMVVFGGFLSSTWVMSLAGIPTWTPLFPSGTVPVEYFNCAMVYDSYRDRAVIYGGGSTYPTGDTHVLSLSGTPTFTKLMPGPSPEGRSAAVAVYDAYRDRMVIHGGQYDGGVTQHYSYEDTDALVWGENVSVPPPDPLPSRSTIRLVRPNPASGSQAFEIELATELGAGSFEVFSVTGQRVWSLELQKLGPGRHVLEWNGRGEHGQNVAAGVYLARLRTQGSTSSQRFVRVQ